LAPNGLFEDGEQALERHQLLSFVDFVFQFDREFLLLRLLEHLSGGIKGVATEWSFSDRPEALKVVEHYCVELCSRAVTVDAEEIGVLVI